MSTSGQTGFILTTTEIIHEALDLCGVAVEDEDLTAEEYNRSLRSLNLMLRTWQSQGIHLWTYQEGTLFLQKDRSSYPLNNESSIRTVISDRLVIDSLNANVASGTTSFSIDKKEITDDQGNNFTISTGNQIGFLKKDSTIFWTTYVDPDTVADPFPEDINEGSIVYWYPDESNIYPVERVLDIRRVNPVANRNSNEVPILFEAHKDFFDLPNKNSTGTVNECTFQRVLPFGVLHVWQVPNSENQLLKFTYERKIQNFVDPNDDPDIPDHFMNAIVWNLAKTLSVKFRLSSERKAEIYQNASAELIQALEFDNANYDIKVTLNRNSRA